MAALTTYTIQCTDDTTGKIGCFIFDREYFMHTGRFKAHPDAPIIHANLVELFRWDRLQYPKVYCFDAYTPSPHD